MEGFSTIVIDPQDGFCKPSGTLAKAYGEDELAEITRVLPKLKLALEASERRHLVISEYSRAQFTGGDESNLLSDLCVPTENDDCRLVDELSGLDYDSMTVKNRQNATEVKSFVSQIEADINSGITKFVIAGFLLEHCVKETALGLQALYANRGVSIFVASDLTASRREKYINGVVESAVNVLASSGIQYQPWQSILE